MSRSQQSATSTSETTKASTPAYVEPEKDDGEPRLAHLPVTFFAVVMGLAGLSLAWLRAAALIGAPDLVGVVLFWFALVVDLAVLVAYGIKVVRYRDAARAELRHPIRLAFVPTVTIAFLLLATAGQEIVEPLARVLWWVGAGGQLVLALFVIGSWIARDSFATAHVNPAWFIPVVGMVVVPLAGVRFAPPEISMFFFSVGLLLWIALLPMVLSRLFVHEHPVPGQLLPTLAVLIAPPAVGFLSLLKLNGGVIDVAAEILFDVAVFFTLVFVTQVGRLHRIPFFLSWWAYSFPLAGLSVATTAVAGAYGAAWAMAIAWVLLVAVSALVVLLVGRTGAAVLAGRICVPE